MKSEQGLIGLRGLLVTALLGVALFDLGAVVIARFQTDGVAIRAADVAANEYANSGSTAKAEAAALALASECACTLVTPIHIDERYAYVTLEKRARTIVAHRIGSLRPRTVVRVTHRGTLTG